MTPDRTPLVWMRRRWRVYNPCYAAEDEQSGDATLNNIPDTWRSNNAPACLLLYHHRYALPTLIAFVRAPSTRDDCVLCTSLFSGSLFPSSLSHAFALYGCDATYHHLPYTCPPGAGWRTTYVHAGRCLHADYHTAGCGFCWFAAARAPGTLRFPRSLFHAAGVLRRIDPVCWVLYLVLLFQPRCNMRERCLDVALTTHYVHYYRWSVPAPAAILILFV